MQTFLSMMSPEDRQRLAQRSQTEHLPAGAEIIRMRQDRPGLVILREGQAQVRVPRAGERWREVATIRPGEVIGEMSFISGDPASASVRCTRDSRVERISAAQLDALRAAEPAFAARLSQSIASTIARRLVEHHASSHRSVEPAFVERLTGDWAKSLVEIRQIPFRPIVAYFVERYEAVAHRDAYLWRWAARGLALTRLPLVPQSLRADLLDTKLLAVILNVLLDDLADNRGSVVLLEAALASLQPHAPPEVSVPAEERPYFDLIRDLWRTIHARCALLPGWERYRMLLAFDYQQVFSAMRYGLLLHHHPALLNTAEHELYPPHNMNMMVFGTLDLMASGGLPAEELSALRELLWRAQSMGQISNMLVTWEREIPDRDFSSRIFALAISEGILTADELATLPHDAIAERVLEAQLEARLQQQWHQLEQGIRALAGRLPSIDVDRYLSGLTDLLGLTLASRRLL